MRTSRSAATPGNSICSAITATATISGNASGPTTGPGQQWTVGCVTLCDPFKVLSPSPGIRVHPCPRKPGKPTQRSPDDMEPRRRSRGPGNGGDLLRAPARWTDRGNAPSGRAGIAAASRSGELVETLRGAPHEGRGALRPSGSVDREAMRREHGEEQRRVDGGAQEPAPAAVR